jgi:hypothetical protein
MRLVRRRRPARRIETDVGRVRPAAVLRKIERAARPDIDDGRDRQPDQHRKIGDLDAGRREDIESLLASVDKRVAPLSARKGTRTRARAPRRWRPAALAASVLLAAAGG